MAVFILKIGAGFLSFKYHHIYFAGGDGAIYLKGGRDLVDYSDKNPLIYLKLFTNQNRHKLGWEEIYDKIIYWDTVKGSELFGDNRMAIRLNSLISLLSFRSVGAHIILLIFLSLIGLMALYKTIRKWFQNIYPPAVFLAIFLTPSIIFWTSGILKETHTILFLGLFLFQLSKFIAQNSFKRLLLTLLFAFLLLLSRTYLAVVLFVPVVFLLISSYYNILKSSILTLGFTSAVLWFVNAIGINPFDIVQAKQMDFKLIGQQANSYYYIADLLKPIDVIKYFPSSLLNVYLQPQLLNFDSWLYVFPIIENFDILTFFILALVFYNPSLKREHRYLIFIILIWVIGGWIIGLTVPVHGAVSRYKSMLMPFLLLSLFSIMDWDSIKSYFLSPK